MAISHHSNFDFLESANPDLHRIISRAESYFEEDPVTCLSKIGQFAELLAQDIIQRYNIKIAVNETQYEILKKLKNLNLIDEKMSDLFHKIRIARNDATHKLDGDHDIALIQLKYSHELAILYHKKFVNSHFIHSDSFIPPSELDISKRYVQLLRKLEQYLEELVIAQMKNKNFLSKRTSNETRKEEIQKELIEKKKRSDKKRDLDRSNEYKKINNLYKKIDQIDLELIKVEIEISDLEDFVSSAEIKSILRSKYQQKINLEHQKERIRDRISEIQNVIKNLSGYSSEDTLQMKALFTELDQLSIRQDQYEEQVTNQIHRLENEIKYLFLEIEKLFKFAHEKCMNLEGIPYRILQKIDQANIHFKI